MAGYKQRAFFYDIEDNHLFCFLNYILQTSWKHFCITWSNEFRICIMYCIFKNMIKVSFCSFGGRQMKGVSSNKYILSIKGVLRLRRTRGKRSRFSCWDRLSLPEPKECIKSFQSILSMYFHSAAYTKNHAKLLVLFF